MKKWYKCVPLPLLFRKTSGILQKIIFHRITFSISFSHKNRDGMNEHDFYDKRKQYDTKIVAYRVRTNRRGGPHYWKMKFVDFSFVVVFSLKEPKFTNFPGGFMKLWNFPLSIIIQKLKLIYAVESVYRNVDIPVPHRSLGVYG